MILHRVIKHFRQLEWTAIFLDFVILVIGVFVGLQANNWNATRVDRADEALFLSALHQDIVEQERISRRILNMRLENFNDLENAVEILFERAPWRELSHKECEAIGSSHIAGIIWTDLPSWRGLREAGRTGIIRDNALLHDLAILVQRQEALDKITEAVQLVSIDIARAHPDLFKVTPVKVQLVTQAGKTEYNTDFVCDGKKLQQNRSAMNALAINIEGFDGVINLVGIMPWLEQIRVVHKQLDKILNISHSIEGNNP